MTVVATIMITAAAPAIEPTMIGTLESVEFLLVGIVGEGIGIIDCEDVLLNVEVTG